MNKNINYDADSIQTLVGLEPFRKSPGLYIGDTGSYGLFHVVKEIVNNSVDEFLNSNVGTNITIKLLEDGGIEISDDGRGFPHGMLDDTFSILGGCFGREHTGGKFNNAGDSGYNSSGGMHGIGCKCASALGSFTRAVSRRDGIEEIVEFSQGKMLKQITDNACDENLHGTTVIWYPDEEIFETTKFDRKKIEVELCQEYSFLNSGLHFTIEEEKNNYHKEFLSEKGIEDYLDFLNKDDNYILSPIILTEEEGDFSVEIGIAYNTSYSNTVKLYTNSIPQESGTHLTGFKTAWTSALNTFAKNEKFLKVTDENLKGEDLAEGQLLVINFKMIDPKFEGQTKNKLTSSEGRTIVQKLVSSSIQDYLTLKRREVKNVVEKALNAKKARVAAKKARETARSKTEKKKKKVLEFDSKLADCSSKNRMECEVYVVEGDSAAGNLKLAKNHKTQAVFPVKGKIINTQKATIEQLQKNAEIMTMIDAFGLTIDKSTLKVTYKKEDLRYGKIIIMSDADVKLSAYERLFA